MKRKLSDRHNKRKTTKRRVNKQKGCVKYSKMLGGQPGAAAWAKKRKMMVAQRKVREEARKWLDTQLPQNREYVTRAEHLEWKKVDRIKHLMEQAVSVDREISDQAVAQIMELEAVDDAWPRPPGWRETWLYEAKIAAKHIKENQEMARQHMELGRYGGGAGPRRAVRSARAWRGESPMTVSLDV